jgi:hypothetical protein
VRESIDQRHSVFEHRAAEAQGWLRSAMRRCSDGADVLTKDTYPDILHYY